MELTRRCKGFDCSPVASSLFRDSCHPDPFQLLGVLQSFSQSLFQKTKALESDLSDIGFDVRAVDIQLQNTINEFLQLSNVQFIEHVSFLLPLCDIE